MPATTSELTLSERKELARDLFLKGYTNADVARELDVHPDTASRYRQEFEEELRTQAAENPQLLRNVVRNTMQSLEELDLVRREAWKEFEESGNKQHRAQLLNTIIRAQDQRGKLFGLFGVKQEFFIHVQSVRVVHQRLLEFMREDLCAEDRRKLEHILTEELGSHLATYDMPVIDQRVLQDEDLT